MVLWAGRRVITTLEFEMLAPEVELPLWDERMGEGSCRALSSGLLPVRACLWSGMTWEAWGASFLVSKADTVPSDACRSDIVVDTKRFSNRFYRLTVNSKEVY